MENKIQKISLILQFIVRVRFMARSLSYFVKISKRIHQNNINLDIIKNVRLVELNISIATVFFNTQILKVI